MLRRSMDHLLPTLVLVAVALAGWPAGARAAAFTSVAAGYDHTCAIRSGGPVSCWGAGAQTQLGRIGATSSRVPLPVIGTYTATQLAAGQAFWCALLQNARVTCAGAGSKGQIGDGGIASAQYPMETLGVRGATRIAAGPTTACAIVGGTVFCWGDGSRGQLGNGQLQYTPQTTPVAVPGVSGATDIAVGTIHVGAIVAGKVICWGDTLEGKLGTDNDAPLAFPGPPAKGIDDASAITVGGHHTCAIRTGGTVWCWGGSSKGQLGAGALTATSTPVQVPGFVGATQISASTDSTCALKNDGTVWCWGDGLRGQLGNGKFADSNVPVQVSGLAGATSVSAGSFHACATTNDRGQTYCWGSNQYGQLGSGGLIGAAAKEATPQLVQDSPKGTARFVPTPLTEQGSRSAGGYVDLRLVKVPRRGGKCPKTASVIVRARGREVTHTARDVTKTNKGCLVTGKFALPSKTQRAFTVIYLVRGTHLRTVKHRLTPRGT